MSRSPSARDGVQDEVGFGNWGEIDEGDPIAEVVHDIGRRRDRQAGLANATGAGQGQQPNTGITQQRDDGGQLLVAGNQGRQQGREVRSGAGRERNRRHERQGRGAQFRRRVCGHAGLGSRGHTNAMNPKRDGAGPLCQLPGAWVRTK